MKNYSLSEKKNFFLIIRHVISVSNLNPPPLLTFFLNCGWGEDQSESKVFAKDSSTLSSWNKKTNSLKPDLKFFRFDVLLPSPSSLFYSLFSPKSPPRWFFVSRYLLWSADLATSNFSTFEPKVRQFFFHFQ